MAFNLIYCIEMIFLYVFFIIKYTFLYVENFTELLSFFLYDKKTKYIVYFLNNKIKL